MLEGVHLFMLHNKFFNAHHSPIGAFASFTLGFKGASGGFDLEMAKPPRQNIFIGLERTDGKVMTHYHFTRLAEMTRANAMTSRIQTPIQTRRIFCSLFKIVRFLEIFK